MAFKDPELLNAIIREAEVKLAEIIDEYKDLEHLNVYGEVVQGELSECIIDYVALNWIELVVMGTSGIGGTCEFLFGSNPQRIVAKVSCPVLTLQPFDRQ